ncbi:MAG: hypothetical protein ACOCXR_02960 [Phototrophicaceae bacterium]
MTDRNNTPSDNDAHSSDTADTDEVRSQDESTTGDDRMDERIERLGGEPAPVITPEEFARLQKAGQVHIDSRGRVRTERPRGVDPGVSLRKRRAWYAG